MKVILLYKRTMVMLQDNKITLIFPEVPVGVVGED